jgi:sugar phosphate isomerase/epimerase
MKAAICNELIADRPLVEACQLIARCGFQGVELAPYTLAEDPLRIPPSQARAMRRVVEGTGLTCLGLHWLLKAPPGLHLTTSDLTVRKRSWDAMRSLVALCRELGGHLMVLGSGQQRSALGVSREEARHVLREGLAGLAPEAQSAGVTVLLEPLPTNVTNVVNTLEEARKIAAVIASPAVASMFDFHNCKDDSEPWEKLIATHFDLIHHVHLNEVDGYHPSSIQRPGRCRSDFLPAFRVLVHRGYRGWVSLEIFHADDPPAEVLQETRSFLDDIWKALHVSR